MRAQVFDVRDSPATNDATIRSNFRDSFAMIGLFFRRQVEKLGVGLTKSVSNAFCLGYICFQIHAYNAVAGITLHFPRGATY